MTAQNLSSATVRATVLKLLSGPQQGAEAGLTDETPCLIGSADECDIVLQGDAVAPRHVRLTVRQGQIHLEVQESPVSVANRLLPPGRIADFATGVVIRLGEVCLGIGPEDADWSHAALPAVVNPATSAVGPKAGDATQSGATPPTAQSPVPESLPALPAKPGTSGKRGLLIVAAGCAILAILIAWWMLSGNRPNSGAAINPTAAAPSGIEKAHAIIMEQGLRDIQVTAHPDGRITLSGYCETEEAKHRLTAILRAQGLRVDNRLWPEDGLQKTIAQTLERFGGERLGYDYLGKGAVRLRGSLRADLSHEELLSTLRNDAPGISHIESAVKTIAGFVADLQKQAREAGLEGQITIAPAGAGLVATGGLDAEHLKRWDAVVRSFTAATRGFPGLENQVKLIEAAPSASPSAPSAVAAPREEPLAPLHIGIRGVVIGPDGVPHALLNDGTRIAEGDRIHGGYVIEKIEFNRVMVRAGAETKVYYVGEAGHE